MAYEVRVGSRWKALSGNARAAKFLVFFAWIGCGQEGLPEVDESIGQTYEQYKSDKMDDYLDPLGALTIDTQTSFGGDGYEIWWRFAISEEDFKEMVTSTAEAQHWNKSIAFDRLNTPPKNWKSDSPPPKWWAIQKIKDATSTHWCYDDGDAERHRGWFFLYSHDSRIAFCWHWNHQWSATECQSE